MQTEAPSSPSPHHPTPPHKHPFPSALRARPSPPCLGVSVQQVHDTSAKQSTKLIPSLPGQHASDQEDRGEGYPWPATANTACHRVSCDAGILNESMNPTKQIQQRPQFITPSFLLEISLYPSLATPDITPPPLPKSYATTSWDRFTPAAPLSLVAGSRFSRRCHASYTRFLYDNLGL